MASLGLSWSTVVTLLYLGSRQSVSGQQTGVYLSLNGTKYANNSVISITEIGETDPDLNQNDGLQCITNRRPCCRFRYRVGEWFFPNGTEVPIRGRGATTFYRNRGHDDGTVNLNRVSSDVMSPTGQFCCVVPDADNVNQSVCVNIVNMSTVPATHDNMKFIIIGGSTAAAAVIITTIVIIIVIAAALVTNKCRRQRFTKNRQHPTTGECEVTQCPKEDLGHHYSETDVTKFQYDGIIQHHFRTDAVYEASKHTTQKCEIKHHQSEGTHHQQPTLGGDCVATEYPQEEYDDIIQHRSGAGGTHQHPTLRGDDVVAQEEYDDIKPHQSPPKKYQTTDDYVITYLTKEEYDTVKPPSHEFYTYTAMDCP